MEPAHMGLKDRSSGVGSAAGSMNLDTDPPNNIGIARSTLTEQIANRLRDMIIQNQLSPGTHIRERAICSQLNVSRTPLREALQVLASEGLVDLNPNRSAVIAKPSAEEIEDMLQNLGVLEGFAGERACQRIKNEELTEIKALHYEMLAAHSRGDRLEYFKMNQRIHLAIVSAARSETLKMLHNLLNARLYRIRYQSFLRNQAWESAIDEHAEILKALEHRDVSRMATLLQNHLKNTWKNIKLIFDS